MWLKRLWRDRRGVINTMDLILMATILVLGTVVGLVCLRNQVIQELSDTATAIGKLNQSYEYTGREIEADPDYTSPSFSASVEGSSFDDTENLDSTVNQSNLSESPTPANSKHGED